MKRSALKHLIMAKKRRSNGLLINSNYGKADYHYHDNRIIIVNGNPEKPSGKIKWGRISFVGLMVLLFWSFGIFSKIIGLWDYLEPIVTTIEWLFKITYVVERFIEAANAFIKSGFT